MTEDETVGWYHRLNGHKFEQAPGDGEWQRSLACCSPWSHKKSDMTDRLNNNNNNKGAFTSIILFGYWYQTNWVQFGPFLPFHRRKQEAQRGRICPGLHIRQNHRWESCEFLSMCHPLHTPMSCQVQHHWKQIYWAIVLKRVTYLCILNSKLRDSRMEE